MAKAHGEIQSQSAGEGPGLFNEIDELEAAEEAQYGDKEEVGGGKEIGTEKLKEVADKINQKLKKDPKNKTLKKSQTQLREGFHSSPREI
jgi:hypothetical protein